MEQVTLGPQDRSEVLRYLEYRGQELPAELTDQVDYCMDQVNQAADPRCLMKIFARKDRDDYPPELAFLTGEDIRRHLDGCEEIICLAATLGSGIDSLLRKTQIRDMADALIMDSCASTLIEAVCDSLDAELRAQYKKRGKYLTFRFSPGYGDLPIGINSQFAALMESRRIGLTVSASGIMIPRKSVTAMIGVSRQPREKKQKSCAACNLNGSCRFRKNGVTCGQ